MPYLVHYEADGIDFRWDGKEDTDGPGGVSSVQLLPESQRRQHCTRPKCVRAYPPITGMQL